MPTLTSSSLRHDHNLNDKEISEISVFYGLHMFIFYIAKQSAVEVVEICHCMLQVQSWILDACHMAKNKTDNLLVRADATWQRSFVSVVTRSKFN